MRKGSDRLTQAPLVNLFGRESKYSQHFNYYFNYRVCHRESGFDLHIRINLETSCEVLDTLENIDEGIVACPHVLGRLGETDITTCEPERERMARTERRTPIPENMSCAGGVA
jgi:hypothetical protein